MDESKRVARRVIVDECVSKESRLMERFRQAWAAHEPIDYVFLAQKHRAIPDEVLLSQMMGPDTVLLTVDRVLHNRARHLGFLSYTINEQGDLTRRPFHGVPIPKLAAMRPGGELEADYAHPANRIATALKPGLTEQGIKRYRTRRRRIRSYFGSEASLAKVSLTVGSTTSKQGVICGFFLAIAGHSGKKGIRASEGYALAAGKDHETGFGLVHALRDVYLLQLERVPVELFVIPEPEYTLARSLVADANALPESASNRALRTLLGGLARVEVSRCVKGPFHDAMAAKLRQVIQPRCNELVTVDFRSVINNLLREGSTDQNGSQYLLTRASSLGETKGTSP